MPWGLTRFHHSGQSHFVTFCCYHRHRLFTTDASCRIFESALERVRRSFRLQAYGYVVMPEHVHLLLSEPQQDTSSSGTAPLKPKEGLSGPPVHPPDVRVKVATRRLGVICSVLLRRSFRNESSKDMAFPHPQSRKDHYRKEDIPSWGGIVWKFFKRTINIPEYRNAKDDVNPSKNRTLGGIIHGRLRERGWCIV